MEHLRQQFPALERTHQEHPVIYLDGPGGSQVPHSVPLAMQNYLLNHNANLGTQFSTARETSTLVEQVRKKTAHFLNASHEEISFGQNMTSLTFAFSRALARTWKAGDHILLSSMDHDANISPWLVAAEERGADVTIIPYLPQLGTITLQQVQEHIRENTKLIAITASSNVLGSHVDIKAICALASLIGSKTYIDAVHHAPHYPIDVNDWNCDFLACSAYKFFGPHIGILYGKQEYMSSLKPYKIEPSPTSAPHCWETGTQNFEAIAGLGAALDYLLTIDSPTNTSFKKSYQHIQQHEDLLKQYFLSKIANHPKWKLHGLHTPEHRAPTFALTHLSLTPAEIVRQLDSHGIFTWAGHMYAIKLMPQLGLDPQQGVLRIGLLHYNTIREIDRLFTILDNL